MDHIIDIVYNNKSIYKSKYKSDFLSDVGIDKIASMQFLHNVSYKCIK